MEVFELFGTIAVQYTDAVDAINRVTRAAEDASDSLGDMGDSAEDAEDPIEDSGEAAEDAEGKFSAWQVTLANLAANAMQKVIDKCVDIAKSVVDLGIDFTATMSEVQAISGASAEDMELLEKTARDFGSTTMFSANDAAQALKFMSLAGWSAEESSSALGGVLDLAAASGMELAQASDMVTDYLSAFGMGAEDAAYFADMLAFAQSNSNTTAEQLGEAYRNCAANLNAAGQDVETVTSLLEAMANQGYKGSQAGTALAAIMRDITNAMDDGAIQIGDTTISVMDAQGNFRDLTDILIEVEAATNGMGDAEKATALSTTFTADSIKGMNLMLNEGMDKIAGYEEALRGSDGAAADMAATMNDNLKGDLASMNSAFEELKLKIFEGAESPLRGLVQLVTDKVVPMLTKLIENFDKIAPVLAGITTAIITFKAAMAISGIIQAAVTAFQAYQAANEGATVAQWLLNAAMSANPIVLIVTLIAGLIAAIAVLWATNEDFRNGVTAVWETVKNAVGTAIDAVVSFFKKAWSFLEGYGEFLYDWISGIVDAVSGFFQSIWNFFVGYGEYLADWVSGIIDGAKNFINSMIEAVSGFFETVWNAIQVGFLFIVELVKGYIQLVTLPWRFIWENCKDYLIAAWEAIKSFVSNAINAVKTTIENILNGIKTFFTTIWNAYVSIVTAYLNAIRTVVTTVFNAVRNFITTVWNAVYTFFSGVLTKIKDRVTSIFNAVKNFVETVFNAVRDFITNIWNRYVELVTAGLNAIWNVVVSVFTAVRDFFVSVWNAIADFLTTVLTNIRDFITGILNGIRDFFSNVWEAISGKISTVITGIRDKVQSIFESVRNTISDKLTAAKNTVVNIFDNIKTSVQTKIEAARDFVKNAIEKIKSFFNFSWSLPKLKLPHFSISGSFSLNPPSVPSFGIDWYAKGGIMERPTVFGFNPSTGRAQVGGEAGAEAIAPIDTLLGFVRTAVREENAALGDRIERIVILLEEYLPAMLRKTLEVILDSGALVGELAPALNDELGNISDDDQRRRG